MNNFLLSIVLSVSVLFIPAVTATDWRKDGSPETKMDNVIKVIPSTVNIMFQVGERYKNLYWAAKQNNWEFAN